MSDSILNPSHAPAPIMSDHPDFGRVSGLEQRLPLVKEAPPPVHPLASTAAPAQPQAAAQPGAAPVDIVLPSGLTRRDEQLFIKDLRSRMAAQMQEVLPLTQVSAGAEDFEAAVNRAREWNSVHRDLKAVYNQLTHLLDDVEQ